VGGQIDVHHGVTAESETPATPDLADGLDDVPWLDKRGGDLGQQRREQQVVGVADEQQLDVATSAELPLVGMVSVPPKPPPSTRCGSFRLRASR
jgi:hypothetical protein